MYQLDAEFFSGNAGQTRWRILQHIAMRGPVDVRLIAEESNLASSTVRYYVDKFLKTGLLQRSGTKEGPGGRPSRLFQFSFDAGSVVGVEISREAIRMNTVDLAGELHSSYEEPLVLQDDVAPAQVIAGSINRGMEQAGTDRCHVIGVGVAVQGLYYGPDDVWLYWPAPKPLHHIPLQSALSRELELPVLVEDHGRVRLLAEQQRGILRGKRNAILVWVGSGIASYFCFDGKVFRGGNGMNGEFGHLIIEPDGPLCRCGRRGCLEAVASIPSIVETTRQQMGHTSLSSMSQLAAASDDLTIHNILQAAEHGDQIAYIALRQAGERIGQAISIMLNVIGPTLVIVGGPLRHSSVVLDAIRDAVRLEVVQPLFPMIDIQASQLGDGAGVLGAAFLEVEHLFAQPRIPPDLLSLWTRTAIVEPSGPAS